MDSFEKAKILCVIHWELGGGPDNLKGTLWPVGEGSRLAKELGRGDPVQGVKCGSDMIGLEDGLGWGGKPR